MEWLEFLSETNALVQKVIGDEASTSSNTAVDAQKDEKGGMCPFMDLAFFINIILAPFGGLFGFLGKIFSRFLNNY